MEHLNRQQRRQAERNGEKLKKQFKLNQFDLSNTYPQKEYTTEEQMKMLLKPSIQFWSQFRIIDIDFVKKTSKDLQFISQVLINNAFIAQEFQHMWTIKFIDGASTEMIINMLMSKFECLTLANMSIKINSGQILQSYYAKENTFKKIEKQCCACKLNEKLHFIICCGSTVCCNCDLVLRKKQCIKCKYPWASMKVNGQYIIQLRSRLPKFQIQPVQIC